MSLIRFFIEIFKKQKVDHTWQNFANEVEGVFTAQHDGEEDQVNVSYKNLNILIDTYLHYRTVKSTTYTQQYTRAIIQYIPKEELKFRIMEQGIYDKITKLFGAQDIQIGNKSFDRRFMIKGTDPAKIIILFNNPIVQELMGKFENLHLQIFDDEGIFDEKIEPNHHMLYFLSEDKIKSVQQLKELLELYKKLIDEMIKLRVIKQVY